ncbi:hypothetical protein DFJ43DRAFT_883646 [Lentinula guzmanii]|uniref:Uncharacterized protein n=1 Tax=Lentinula guzmanii TaxID=2804957 RepID=A0AA38J7D9_9AGAR|nr:hypothetical protein DFJ43DRAFT_883646 [Lentinula guzmanii]
MDSHQSSVSEDHSSDPGSPPKSPQSRSTPSPDSARTLISGAFFAGAHSFSINGGSFNNSNGDIHQDIVNDHSYRSNFGNRYGDNLSNSSNRTSSYNADYNDNRRYESNRWTQTTARAQFHYEQNFAGSGQGGRTSAPPNFQSPIPPIPASAYPGGIHRPSTAPLQVGDRATEDEYSRSYGREGPEYYHNPRYGPARQPYPDYDSEGDDEEQSQPQLGERQAHRAEPDPEPSSSTTPRPHFKSNNPYAKLST